jgi:hypothetical protein
VKVSLFLQDGIQSTDGAIIITHKGVMATGTEVPGTIRYFDADGKVSREEKIKLKNTDDAVVATEEFDVTKPTRPCTLGTNLYVTLSFLCTCVPYPFFSRYVACNVI